MEFLKNKQIKVYFLLIFISVLLASVKYSGLNSEPQRVTVLYGLENENYLKTDWFINIYRESPFNVYSYYSQFLIILNKVIDNYEITFMLFYFSCILLYVIGFFNLLHFLTKNPRLALFASILPLIGGYLGIGSNFETFSINPSLLAWALVLWSLYYFLKQNWILSFTLLGIASIFQFLVGLLPYAVFIIVILLTKKEYTKKNRILIKSIPFVILFLLTAIPLIKVQIETQSELTSEQLVYIIGEYTHPHHYMPFSWPLFRYIVFFTFLSLVGISILNSKIALEYKTPLKYMILVILGFFLIGTIFVEFIPIALILKLQLFRLCIFLQIIGYLFIGEFFYNRIKNCTRTGEKMFYFAAALSLVRAFYFLPFILTLLVLEIIKNKKIYQQIKVGFFSKLNTLFLILLVPILIFSFILAPLLIIKTETIGPTIYNIIFPFILMTYALANKKVLKFTLLIILLIGGIMNICYYPLTERDEFEPKLKELCLFTQNSTPKDTILLSPPHLYEIRLCMERAAVVDFLTFPFQEKDMVEWYERILDVTNTQNTKYKKEKEIFNPEDWSYNWLKKRSTLKKGYESLTEKDISNLKIKYNFSYAIFEKPKELNFSKAYENEKYTMFIV